MWTKTAPAWRALLFLICLSSFPAFVRGQSGAPAPASASSSADRRVTLDVVVTDKSGKVVPGLQQEDFTLLDNKQPQKIVSFQAVDGTTATAAASTQIFLLFDAVNASIDSISFERLQLAKFLNQSGGQLAQPVEIDFFSDPGDIIRTEASRDGNALLANFDQHASGLRAIRSAASRHAPQDAIQISLNAVGRFIADEMNQPGRKMFIWVSPGWPILTGPFVLSDKDKQGIFENIVSFSTQLRQARVTIYSAEPLGTGATVANTTPSAPMGALAATPTTGALAAMIYDQFVDPVKTAKKAEQSDMSLQVFASQTGGLVLGSGNDIAGEIEKCLADAKASYVVSFDSPVPGGANEFHAIQLKVGKPGLTARTRVGYYDQP